jgi:hypothetical protein
MMFTTFGASPLSGAMAISGARCSTLACTDGTLAANTAKDGVLGALWRVKYTTVGTYAGGTTLNVDITTNAVRAIR